jgi:hypothetical protein
VVHVLAFTPLPEGDSYGLLTSSEHPRSVAYTVPHVSSDDRAAEQPPRSTLALTPPPMAAGAANSGCTHATGYGCRLQSAAVSTSSSSHANVGVTAHRHQPVLPRLPSSRFLATLYAEGDSYAADKKEVPRSVAYTGHTARVTSSTSEQLPSTLALTPPPMASVANSDAHATGYGRRLQSAAVSTTSRTQRRAASPPPPTTALARGSRLWPCRPG